MRVSTITTVTLTILAASVLAPITAPALAAPTKVTWPVAIHVAAAPGTENHIAIIYEFLTDEGGVTTWATGEDGAWFHLIGDIPAGVTTVETHDGLSCFLPKGPSDIPAGTVGCFDTSSVAPFLGGGEDFVVSLGDRNDTFDVRSKVVTGSLAVIGSLGSFEVHAGSGNDKVYGNEVPALVFDEGDEGFYEYWTQDALSGDQGNDLLVGGPGADFLSGGSGADTLDGGFEEIEDEFYTGEDDTLLGGPGNDRILAWHADHDPVINCGPGRRDKAIIDRGLDPKPKGCEIVIKKPPAGAVDAAG